MGHYAFINSLNKVVSVITGKDDGDNGMTWEQWETFYSERKGLTCKRTCKKTSHNEHKDGGTPFRKNYAGVGYTFDPNLDAFIPPKPHNSWVMDESIADWVAPVDYPEDENPYVWNEETQSWDLIIE